MCTKCDLGHPEACDNGPEPWMDEAIEAVGVVLDEVAASAAGMDGSVPLDERDCEADAARVVQTVLAIVDSFNNDDPVA